MFGSAARAGCPRCIHENEGIDVTDEWLHRQPTPMRVRSDSSSDRQPVRAGLFLGYSPRLTGPVLQSEIAFHQLWPLDPSFHLQNSALTIQMEHPIELSDIDQKSIGAKLLPSHRMPPTRH